MASKEIIASVTDRGQVTIPAEIRRLLGLKGRSQVAFEIEDGSVRLAIPEFTLESAFASVRPLNRPEDFKKMIRESKEDKADETVRKMRGG